MFYYRNLYGLKNVSKNFYIGGQCNISKDFIAGDYSFVGVGTKIYPNVRIGNYTLIANNVSIIASDHVYSNPNIPIIFSKRPLLKDTVIGSDVWIGANSIIMGGVKIGDGAIIAAGSIVTKDIPAYEIHGGVPTKFIKKRFTPEEIIIHQQMLITKNFKVDFLKKI